MSIELINGVTYSYYAISVITTMFFIYSLYLLFYMSTPQMRDYKYFLLNIQVATYMDTICNTLLLCPIWMNPYFGINADGLLWKLFRVPPKYTHSISAGLYCCGTCSLCSAYFYRYRLILYASVRQISNRALKILIVSTYVVSVGIALPLSAMAWKEHNESVADIKKIDPEVYLGDSFILLGGPTFNLFIYYATAIAVLSFLIFVGIAKHTSIILRNQAAFSEMSRKMHQSAISGLVVQTITITMTVCIPTLMLCISFYIGPSLVTSTDAYVWIGSVMMSMKSCNGTIAMIVMTTSYRNHFMKITGLRRIWPQVEPVQIPPTMTTARI